MLAQVSAGIPGSEQPAAAQFRDHLGGEVVEGAREIREDHAEAVRAPALEPFLDVIGDRLRGVSGVPVRVLPSRANCWASWRMVSPPALARSTRRGERLEPVGVGGEQRVEGAPLQDLRQPEVEGHCPAIRHHRPTEGGLIG